MGLGLQLEEARTKRSQWSDANVKLLESLFDPVFVQGYKDLPEIKPSLYPPVSEHGAFIENIECQLDYLEGLATRVDSTPESSVEAMSIPAGEKPEIVNKIFIVHGHDVGAKEVVARLVEKLGLRPVILHEEPSGGRTIIEKLEKYSNVGFAVVLLTPDDRGGLSSNRDALKLRARQNVIFELGYFIGKLGRSRVCALYKGGIELPSDYERVVYVELDSGGGWQLTLAKELKNAGFTIDLNKLSA